ncbi:MAG: PD40 domain-containing protein [Candidatus Latescibacteria bacterium]|nr:PD40 domain-containing protein [Candidatus Latescibacterota bacterium]
MDLDGGNRVRVSEKVDLGALDNEGPSWSPDGSKIVFMSNRGGSNVAYQIWMVNADGSDPVKVGQSDQWFPAWSPLPRAVVAPSAVRALSWGQVKAGGW